MKDYWCWFPSRVDGRKVPLQPWRDQVIIVTCLTIFQGHCYSLSLSLHYKRFVPNRFGLNRDGRALSRRSLFMYLSSTLCFCSCTCPAYDQDIASCSVGADECAVSFEPGAQFSLSIWTVTRRQRWRRDQDGSRTVVPIRSWKRPRALISQQ